MAAVHEHEEMHHLVDRLPAAQVRRLRALAASDPDLARFVETATTERADDRRRRLASFIGIMDSAQGDLAERHEEIIREGLDRSA